MWAVIIINSTHFKTTDCYLANSLGGAKTNIIVRTSILYHGIPDHFSKESLYWQGPTIWRGTEGARGRPVSGRAWSHLPKAQMFASSLLNSTSTTSPSFAPTQISGIKSFLISLILIRDNHLPFLLNSSFAHNIVTIIPRVKQVPPLALQHWWGKLLSGGFSQFVSFWGYWNL